MENFDIFLLVLLIVVALYIFSIRFQLSHKIDIIDVERHIDDEFRKRRLLDERDLKFIQQEIANANNDVKVLAKELGYVFDTKPPIKSKRLVKKIDEYNEEQQNDNIEIL